MKKSTNIRIIVLLIFILEGFYVNGDTVYTTGPVSGNMNIGNNTCTISGTRIDENWRLNGDAKCSGSGLSNTSVVVNTEIQGVATGTIPQSTTSFTFEIYGTASTGSGTGGPVRWHVTGTNKNYVLTPNRQTIAHGGQPGTIFAFKGTTPESSYWRARILGTANWSNWTSTASTERNVNSSVSPEQYEIEGQSANTGENDIAYVDVYDIRVVSGNTIITRNTPEDQRFLYITGVPAMPAISVELLGGDKEADASININYTLRHREMTTTGSSDGELSKDHPWVVELDEIRGGTATVTAQVDGVQLQSIEFYIRGLNPTAQTVREYFDSIEAEWYVYAIANRETGFRQMNGISTEGALVVGVDTTVCKGATPNEANVQDGGVGMFQITNPAPTANSVWDWRANTTQGLAIIDLKRTLATNLLNNQMALSNNTAIPATTVGGVTFQDNNPDARPVLEACLIKAYNGLATWSDATNSHIGNRNYAQWNTTTNRWEFFPINCYPSGGGWVRNPYLEGVCLAR